MTELEFEKACRGTLYPVANEYAWGTSSIVTYSNLLNAGTTNEVSSAATANATTRTQNVLAPTRVGMFAKPDNTRIQSGATYYGILDMTGNLWERPVTVGNPTGRSYTGQHGDGTITSEGTSNVTNWPLAGGIGSGYRGGYWNSTSDEGVLRIAGRQYAAQPSDRRRERYGIRGVRTAPSN
jgi:formylglycine-generating enzyme required for sulfatase activity